MAYSKETAFSSLWFDGYFDCNFNSLFGLAEKCIKFFIHILAALVIGGALGNAIDRLLYGAVADFINITCCGFRNPYSFNLADVFIFIGLIGLLVFKFDEKQN